MNKACTIEGKCLRCSKELKDSKSLQTLVGPECRDKHWIQDQMIKTCVLIRDGEGPLTEWERIQEINRVADETSSDIVFECITGLENEPSSVRGRPHWDYDVKVKVQTKMWIRCDRFITELTEKLEKAHRKTVEILPFMCVGKTVLQEEPDAFLASGEVEEGHTFRWNGLQFLKEVEGVHYASPFYPSQGEVMQIDAPNGKFIAFNEMPIRRMKGLTLIYADTPENCWRSARSRHKYGEALDYPDVHIHDELSEEFYEMQIYHNMDIFDDAELGRMSGLFDLNKELCLGKPYDEYSGLLRELVKDVASHWNNWVYCVRHQWDDWEQSVDFACHKMDSFRDELLISITQGITALWKPMPKENKFDIENEFTGGGLNIDNHELWTEMSDYDGFGISDKHKIFRNINN